MFRIPSSNTVGILHSGDDCLTAQNIDQTALRISQRLLRVSKWYVYRTIATRLVLYVVLLLLLLSTFLPQSTSESHFHLYLFPSMDSDQLALPRM